MLQSTAARSRAEARRSQQTHGVSEEQALSLGVDEKAVEFVAGGAKTYRAP